MVRKYKRKTEDRWSKEDLLEALVSIKEAKLRINDAARQFGISRATLYRQYQKFIQSGARYDPTQFRTCGGNPILSRVEEDVLEKTIKDLREQGFTVNSTDIKRICFEYCDTNSIPNQFSQEKRMASDDWYYGFLKRHPELRVARPDGKGGSGNRTSEPSAATGSAASSGSTNPVQVIPSSSKVTSSEPILVPPEQGQLKKPLKRLGGGLKSAEAKKVAQDKAEEVDIDAILMGVVKHEVEQEGEDEDDEGERNQNEQMETEGDDEEDDDSEEFEEEEETSKAVEEDAEMAEEEEEQQEKEDSESDEEEEGDGNDKEAAEEEDDEVDAEEDDETAEDMGEDELEEEEMEDNDEEDVDEEEAVEEEENDGNEEDEESEESESEDE